MYTESVEEARTHLISLVKSRLSRPTDTMAIVCVWDSSPIYHQSGHNTVDSLMADPMYKQSYSVWEQITTFCKGAWLHKMIGLRPI